MAEQKKPETRVLLGTKTEIEVEVQQQGFLYPTGLDQSRNLPRTSRYLDEEQRREAEIDRAVLEGREPNLKNPPATQGTPLRTVEQLQAANTVVPQGTKPDVVLPVVVVK